MRLVTHEEYDNASDIPSSKLDEQWLNLINTKLYQLSQ